MKILFINDISNTSVNLCVGLNKLNVETKIFNFSSGGSKYNIYQRALKILFRIKELFILIYIVKKYKPDFIHINYGYYGVVGRLFKVPHAIHFHGSDIRSNFRNRFLKWLTLVGTRKAKIILYSTPDLQFLMRNNFKNPFYLPNPIIIRNYKSIIKNDIFCISKLDRTKGVNIFIKAIKIIKKNYPKTKIKILNFGNINNNNKLISNVDFDKINHSLSNIKFLKEIACSKIIIGQFQLGFLGMSELEAMSLNKPVITCVKNKYYQDGYYKQRPPIINARTAAEIVRSYFNLINGETKLFSGSRKWVKRYHSCEKIAKIYLEILNKNYGRNFS